mmetsp:Transcript_3282/g.5553  ORF Transcript_3282/g.5553 Transcript_3282/m.5553 type:complete len:133 (-) Transcript_3282:1541-1939(-)
MTNGHEIDIRESFAALDHEKKGYIDLEGLHTLYLGLGYGRISLESLSSKVHNSSRISMSDAIALLSELPRNRKQELEVWFRLADNDGDGAVTTDDLIRLAAAADDPLSRQECEALMGCKKRWTKEDLQVLLS